MFVFFAILLFHLGNLDFSCSMIQFCVGYDAILLCYSFNRSIFTLLSFIIMLFYSWKVHASIMLCVCCDNIISCCYCVTRSCALSFFRSCVPLRCRASLFSSLIQLVCFASSCYSDDALMCLIRWFMYSIVRFLLFILFYRYLMSHSLFHCFILRLSEPFVLYLV